MRVKLALAGEGRGCTPTPSHYIYHHQQSCSVRSSWVGRHTNPVSSLGKYVLCGFTWGRKSSQEQTVAQRQNPPAAQQLSPTWITNKRKSPFSGSRDILVWIRIRGSVPLTYGSGSYFLRKRLTRCQQKKFFSQRFWLLLFEGTFTSVFIAKKSKRRHKIVEIMFFSYFFPFFPDPDPYKIMTDPGGLKTYASGSTTLPGRRSGKQRRKAHKRRNPR